MALKHLVERYETLKKHANSDLLSEDVTTTLLEIVEIGLDFLESQCKKIELESKVPGKTYFAFQPKDSERLSRPVNVALYLPNSARNHLHAVLSGQPEQVPYDALREALYSSAMAYCCATDTTKRGDKKTPGTYFEKLVAHIMAKQYGVQPTTSTKVLNLDMDEDLTTDYVFDLGSELSRIHLPIKTSTRERGIMVWAHQRILDSIYGVGRFRGVLVSLAETLLREKERAVYEVCVPKQWQAYQMFIAQVHRVYYFDPPAKYMELENPIHF